MLLGGLLLVFTLELSLLCRKRFEVLLPVLAGAAVLVCYGLAMFRALPAFLWVVSAAALLGLFAVTTRTLQQKRHFVRDLFDYALTPGLLCFVLVVAGMAFSAQPHRVYHTDDLYEWALQPLSLYFRDGFVGPSLHLSPDFMTYTPGVALFQWMGLAIYGGWNEGIASLWLWLAYAVFLLPFTDRITWKKAWQVPLYAVAILLLPALFDADAYAILRVDVLLGICLGYTLVTAWRIAAGDKDRRFLSVSLSFALSFLVLVKQTGIAWLLIPTMILLAFRQHGHSLKKAILPLLLPLAVFFSWVLFCQLTGLRGEHTSALADNAGKLFSGQIVTAQDAWALLGAVCVSFFRGTVPLVALAVISVVSPLLLAGFGRLALPTAKRLSLWVGVSMFAFVLMFYVAMLTVFRSGWTSPVDAAGIVPLMDHVRRYGCALWYALLMLFVYLSITPNPSLMPAKQKTQLVSALLAGACCILVLSGVDWRALTMNLVPGRYVENPVSAELDELTDASSWAGDLPDPQNAIVLLASDSYPANRKWLQYTLAPLKVVMPFQTEWTEDEFVDLLQKNDIQYFVSEGTENNLCQIAAEYAEDGLMEDYTVYAVNWEDGTPVLTDVSDL